MNIINLVHFLPPKTWNSGLKNSVYLISHPLELPSRWWWVSAVIGWGQAPPPTPRCPRCCRPERPAERDTSRRPSTVCWSRWGSRLGPPETQHTTDHDQALNADEQVDELDGSVGNTTDSGVPSESQPGNVQTEIGIESRHQWVNKYHHHHPHTSSWETTLLFN